MTARYNELKDSSDDIVLQNAIGESEVDYEIEKGKPFPENDWRVLINTAPIFDQIDSLVSKKSKIDILNETKSDEFHCLMERSKLQCTQDGFKIRIFQCGTLSEIRVFIGLNSFKPRWMRHS